MTFWEKSDQILRNYFQAQLSLIGKGTTSVYLPILGLTLSQFKSNVTLHAHESSTKFTSLQHLNWEGTMHNLYNEFLKGRLGNKASLNEQTVEICFMYLKDDIVHNLSFPFIKV